MRGLLASIALLVAGVGVGGFALAPRQAQSTPIGVKPGVPAHAQLTPFQSAETCRSCHLQIFTEWRDSWMAKSYTNRLFQRDYARWKAYTKDKPQLDAFSCLRCHAPVAFFSGDLTVQNPVSREGVSCDVCHRVAATKEKNGALALVLDPRNIKYGPHKDPKTTPFHEGRYSEVVIKSELCGACHFDTLLGVPLEWTYKEWKDSPYAAKGIECQDCHMRQVATGGRASKRPTTLLSSHRFAGGALDLTAFAGSGDS